MAIHSSILAWKIPLDRGDWLATVHRVSKSWTQLKLLSTKSNLGENYPELGFLSKRQVVRIFHI